MRWAEPWAYGELGLLPWEFWKLTPREFMLKLDGFWRNWTRMEVLAFRHVGLKESKEPIQLWQWIGRMPECFPRGTNGDDDATT